MFFKVPPREINTVVTSLNAQRELLDRQLNEGTLSREKWQTEQQRLSCLISSYNDNMLSAVHQQKNNLFG